MSRKIISMALIFTLVLSLVTLSSIPALANDISSSTIVFEASADYPLTYNGDGTYTGIIPCVVGGGYDVYAKEGASAWFGDNPGTGPVWTEVVIASHDPFPEPEWDPDTPDWYQYSLYLYEEDGVQKWAIRNHPGATETDPWYTDEIAYPARGVPLSGIIDWNTMYAMETDIGEYLPGTGTAEIPGGAAGYGGGAGYWDMDWSWGSEAIPLQYPGFDVNISGSTSTTYVVTMTPANAGTTYLTAELEDIVAISVDPTSIDFGSLIPGQSSDEYNIEVTNVGTHTVTVNADVISITGDLFYSELRLKNVGVSSYSQRDWPGIITGLTMGTSKTLSTYLPVPSSYVPNGVEEAQLEFTAVAE